MSQSNVLLIIMDSVRASNTSLYDYENETTPYLEEFHNQHGTLFEKCWAPSTWSLPSHTSMFTSTHAEEHRIDSPATKLQPDKSIFYQLSNEGYETGLFSHNVWLTKMDVGLKDGFDTVVDSNHLPYPEALSPLYFDNKDFNGEYAKYTEYLKECLRNDESMKSVINGIFSKTSADYPRISSTLFNEDRSGFTYVDEFVDWVNSTRDQQTNWAACINLMDAHGPYKPEDEFNNWSDEDAISIRDSIDDTWEFHNDTKLWKLKALESLYDGCIRQADSIISDIIEHLKEINEFSNTHIVITSDHGEGFGEYNCVSGIHSVGHKPNITESLLRVPLLVKEPHQEQSSTVTELSTLTGYADSIRSMLDDDDELASQFYKKPVLASFTGMMPSNKELALNYLDDVDRFDKIGRVTYKQNSSDYTVKYMSWGDKTGSQVLDSSCQIDPSVEDVITDEFSKLEDTDMDVGDGDSSVAPSVENRLEELGYK